MKLKFQKASGFLLLVFIVAFWEVYSKCSASIFLPPFSKVLNLLIENLGQISYWSEIVKTLSRCFIGFFIACALMIPLGVLMGRFKFFSNLFEPLVEILRPMPSSAIIPIAILFLGIESEMKVFVIFFGASWPVLVNTIHGVKSVEEMYLKTAKVFDFSNFKTLFKVIIPAALPSIFAGLRISLPISLILSITVEMIVGGNGIGYYILDCERSFKFSEMYAGIITIGILGYVIMFIFTHIEKNLLFWFHNSENQI